MSNIFDGVWIMERDVSKKRNLESGQLEQEPIQHQVITLQHDGDVQDYEVVVTEPDNTLIRMGYRSKFGESKWVPYEVRSIEGDKNSPYLGPTVVRPEKLEVGKPHGYCVQIKVDDLTHYRIVKNNDGTAGYVMERHMSPDGQTYVAYVMLAGGILDIVKVFRRQS